MLVERLALTSPSSDGPTELEGVLDEPALQRHFATVLQRPGVVSAVAALVVTARSGQASTGSSTIGSGASGGNFTGAGAEGLSRQLAAIRLRFVRSLPTRLAVRDPRQPLAPELPLSTSSSPSSLLSAQAQAEAQGHPQDQALAFVLPLADITYSHELLVNCSLASPPLSVEVGLALGLCRVLGLDTALAATLGCLLAADGPAVRAQEAAAVSLSPGPISDSLGFNAAQAVLNALRVGSDAVSIREQQRGQPGEPLAVRDKQLLELKPFRVFRAGEIVASAAAHLAGLGLIRQNHPEQDEFQDPEYQSDVDVDNIGVEDLRYAIVVSAGSGNGESPGITPNSGAGSSGDTGGVRRLVLRGSHDRQVSVLCTSVYSFKSARDAAAQSQAKGGQSTGISGWGAALIRSSAADAVASPSASALTSSSSSGSSSGLPVSLSGVGSGAVSPAEVMGAVQGLLRRAGVPVSLEQKVSLYL